MLPLIKISQWGNLRKSLLFVSKFSHTFVACFWCIAYFIISINKMLQSFNIRVFNIDKFLIYCPSELRCLLPTSEMAKNHSNEPKWIYVYWNWSRLFDFLLVWTHYPRIDDATVRTIHRVGYIWLTKSIWMISSSFEWDRNRHFDATIRQFLRYGLPDVRYDFYYLHFS